MATIEALWHYTVELLRSAVPSAIVTTVVIEVAACVLHPLLISDEPPPIELSSSYYAPIFMYFICVTT